MPETPEQRSERMRWIGRLGGLKTKKRMLAKNPYFYEEIGTISGLKLRDERGVDYYAALGRKGAAVTNKKRWGAMKGGERA